ncbi:hypothetical protein [Siminovitchia sp. 179-K 8D1 HS]|uniref:hypothetical protein n=1 Tax=Siminovitchia sp. 179-K 8D1 HS TaxID=3142385 RepID=UPI0039A1E5DC
MELGNLIFGNSRGKYLVDRDWQDAFYSALYDMRFNGYGMPELDESEYNGKFVELKSKYGNTKYFENDTFIIMPYYWGDDDDFCELPNFIHKSSGYELSWYKYALRDSYANKEIAFEELMNIMDDCKKSLGFEGVPHNYLRAIEHIESAMDELYCTDNKEETIDIYNKLREIKEGME